MPSVYFFFDHPISLASCGSSELSRRVWTAMKCRNRKFLPWNIRKVFWSFWSPLNIKHLGFSLTDFDQILMYKYLHQISELLVKSPSFYFVPEKSDSPSKTTTSNWFLQQPMIFSSNLKNSIKIDFPNRFFCLMAQCTQEGVYFWDPMAKFFDNFFKVVPGSRMACNVMHVWWQKLILLKVFVKNI